MEDGGREDAVRSGLERIGEMLEPAGTSRGDHRNRHRRRRRGEERQIIADAGAVAVHRGEQDLARAEHLAAGITEGGADAVLAASIFHFREHTIAEAKAVMAERGITVRTT